MKLSNKLKLLIFISTLVAYLAVPVTMFTHLSEMAETNTPMEHCPFAFGEHQVCLMSSLEHISAWEKFLFRFLSPFELAIVAVIFFSYLRKDRSILISRYLLYFKQKGRYRHSFFLYLFSQGILNPKLF